MESKNVGEQTNKEKDTIKKVTINSSGVLDIERKSRKKGVSTYNYYPDNKYVISSYEISKIKKHLCSPEHVTVNKKTGDITIKFEDKTIGKYPISTIISIITGEEELKMAHFNQVFRTYAKLYCGDKILTEYSEEDFESPEEYEMMKNTDEYIKEVVQKNNEANGVDGSRFTPEENLELIRKIYKVSMKSDFILIIYLLENLERICSDIKVPVINIDINENSKMSTESIVKEHVQTNEEQYGKLLFLLDYETGEELGYEFIKELVGKNSITIKALTQEYKGEPLSDKSVIKVLNNLLEVNCIREFVCKYAEHIVDRKAVVNYLIDNVIMTQDELRAAGNKSDMLDFYRETENKEFLKYLDKEDIARLYLVYEIDFQTFKKYGDLNAILSSEKISNSDKVKILTQERKSKTVDGKEVFTWVDLKSRVFEKSNTSKIWELFELGDISLEDVKRLEKLRYMHGDTLIENYNESKKRAIATELGIIDRVSEDKLYAFYTPDVALRDIRSGVKGDNKELFYKTDLKRIYAERNDDLAKDISDLIVQESDGDKSKSDIEHMKLYKQGFIEAKTLKEANISEDRAINFYYNNEEHSQILIDFYNAGVITQDTVFELCGDNFEEAVANLIDKGMSPRILSGLYSTAELIEKVKSGSIDIKNLVEIKSEIKTGLGDNTYTGGKTLVDMYTSELLTYAELYELANNGIITRDEADEINKRYSVKKDLDALISKGVIGSSTNFIEAMKNVTDKTETEETSNKGARKPNKSHEAIGIDHKDIEDFYKAMGVTEAIRVDPEECPVFEGYVLFIAEDKEIGFFEGEGGRTYILPLKIILEQIKNPGSEADIIRRATSRSEFNKDKTYLRSANHTRNWIKNTAEKAAELSSEMMKKDPKAKKFLKGNEALLKRSQEAYDKRKNLLVK